MHFGKEVAAIEPGPVVRLTDGRGTNVDLVVLGTGVVPNVELAAAAGSPRAMRAAGSAMATNAVAPFVPCHRVIRAGGDLGQYAYGVERKRRLLEHEGALPTA